MCALAAASLIAAPVIVNADAGAPAKHKAHKHKAHKKASKRGKICRRYKTVTLKNGKKRRVCTNWAGKRSAGALPRTKTVTTATATPAPPPPPQTYVPYTPPQAPAATPPSAPAAPAPQTSAAPVMRGHGLSFGSILGITAASFALGGAIGSAHSPGG